MVAARIILAASIVAACDFAAPAAQTHAFLDHASPAVGSTVPSAPPAVTMWFTQQLEPAFTTAAVTDASGNPVEAGPAQVDTKDPTKLKVSLKKLPPGTYSVQWHALSVDTHTTTGHFSFQVGGK